jgi:hypothetical protein
MSDPTDPRPDIRLRTLLSSWKRNRGFRSVAAHYRKQLVPNAGQTDLNREFANRGRASAGWFFIALLVLAAIDYLCLRITPSAGL